MIGFMRIFALLLLFLRAAAQPNANTDERPIAWDKAAYPIPVPFLETAPVIDGDLSDWKYRAFSDGVWDLARVMHTPWYDAGRNRLTLHPGETGTLEDDLSARYYIAWDKQYLYLGAEVHDNINDVSDPNPHPKQWYFRDSVCWFIEAPRRAAGKIFGRGDNAFCFTAAPGYPPWWRHGSPSQSRIEEPLPKSTVQFVVRMNPWGRSKGDFILEARIAMAATLGKSDPAWRAPKIGDEYGLEIVHCDPDGGGYGGHLMIYGTGDNDSTWGIMKLTAPLPPVVRKPD